MRNVVQGDRNMLENTEADGCWPLISVVNEAVGRWFYKGGHYCRFPQSLRLNKENFNFQSATHYPNIPTSTYRKKFMFARNVGVGSELSFPFNFVW